MLGIFLVIGSDLQRRDARSHGRPPRRMTVAEVLNGGARRHDYVTVVGSLDPRAGLLHGREGALSEQDVLIPMVDPRTNRALLVERSKSATRTPGSPPGAEVAITGMLRPLSGKVGRSLRENGGRLGSFQVSTEFRLAEGEQPVNPRWFWLTLGLAGVPFLLLLVSLLLRHVVFQPGPASQVTPDAPPAAEPLSSQTAAEDTADLRVTGRLRFGEKVAQRFLDIPAQLAAVPETGGLAIVSLIDASQHFQGMITDSRDGVWSVVARDGTLDPNQAEPGLLYAGLHPRPALRLRFTDQADGKPATVILSFPTIAARDRERERLQDPRLWQPRRAAEPAPTVESPPPPAEPVAEAAPPLPVEPLTPYRSSGRCSPAGFVTLLAFALPGAVLAGVLYQLLTRFIEIPFVFPILGGLMVGGVVWLAVRASRCRSVALAVIVGLVGGVVMYGTRLALDSQQFRPLLVAGLSSRVAQAQKVPYSLARRQVAQSLDAWETLQLFLRLQSRMGVGIGDSSSKSLTQWSAEGGEQVLDSGASFTIQGPWYWGMLFLETLLVAGIAAGIGASGTRHPFCERCRRWHARRPLVRTDPANAPALLAAARECRWDRLLSAPPGGTEQHYGEVALTRCPRCAGATLQVRLVPSTAKDALHAVIEPETANYLETHAPPPPEKRRGKQPA